MQLTYDIGHNLHRLCQLFKKQNCNFHFSDTSNSGNNSMTFAITGKYSNVCKSKEDYYQIQDIELYTRSKLYTF